uniref:Uncharacterized protein n=1 Tax=Meloidogyne enterolobii TaxID=390850 RepID=A0A6V7X664_MELEN|nr:unnamed protein product [Meloidogyne enterolobii]
MVYGLINEKPISELCESKLDRVIKACFQDDSIRPNIQEIINFLNDDIVEFEYERIHQTEYDQEPIQYLHQQIQYEYPPQHLHGIHDQETIHYQHGTHDQEQIRYEHQQFEQENPSQYQYGQNFFF